MTAFMRLYWDMPRSVEGREKPSRDSILIHYDLVSLAGQPLVHGTKTQTREHER